MTVFLLFFGGNLGKEVLIVFRLRTKDDEPSVFASSYGKDDMVPCRVLGREPKSQHMREDTSSCCLTSV
jgi:hypothetical protein